MAYKIQTHEEDRNTRIMDVIINPDAPEKEQIIEHFEWGMDVPLAQVKVETARLLDAKHAKPAKKQHPKGNL